MICRILFLLFVSSSTAFDVNVTQIKYHEKENHNVTLEWTFTTNSSISWKKTFVSCDLITDGKSFGVYQISDGKEVPQSDDQHFSGRVKVNKDDLSSGRIRLHVSRLRTTDSGQYVCDIDTNYGRGSASTELEVTQALPSLVVNVTQKNYQAEENHNVTLEWTFTTNDSSSQNKTFVSCDLITDHKSFVLYRVRDGEEVPHSHDQHFSGRVQSECDLSSGRIRLHVSRLRTEDSGLYVCDVDTNLGRGSASTQLEITQVLPPFVVNVTQQYYQAEENHNVTLEWTFTTTKTKLEETNIFCEHLTKEKSSVLCLVFAGENKPESVSEGFSGRVQSESDLSSGQIRLHVSRLRTEDSGQYVCEVETGSGSGSNHTELNVTAEAPRPTERPTPSPQPETRRWTGLIITGVTVGGVLVCVCVICFIFRIKRPSNSQGVRNSRTPLFGTE